MALITCTECGKQFSDKASACPNCGCPTKEVIKSIQDLKNTENDKISNPACPYCGEVINPNDDYCDSCGSRLTSYVKIKNSSTEENNTSKTTSHQPFSQRKKKQGKGCLPTIITLFIIAAVVSGIGSKKEDALTSTTDTNAESQEFETESYTENSSSEAVPPLSDKEIFIKKLISNPDVSESAAAETYEIIHNTLGFEKITINENISGTLFNIAADDYNLKITVSDKLYHVICGDYTLYEDDTSKYTKQDLEKRKIGDKDSYYYAIAKEAVSSHLKNPSNAHFCSIWNCQMARNGEYVVVKGYVDATNSFGAKVRSEFVVEFKVIDLSTFSYETIYINIDGEVSGTYVDLK